MFSSFYANFHYLVFIAVVMLTNQGKEGWRRLLLMKNFKPCKPFWKQKNPNTSSISSPASSEKEKLFIKYVCLFCTSFSFPRKSMHFSKNSEGPGSQLEVNHQKTVKPEHTQNPKAKYLFHYVGVLVDTLCEPEKSSSLTQQLCILVCRGPVLTSLWYSLCQLERFWS